MPTNTVYIKQLKKKPDGYLHFGKLVCLRQSLITNDGEQVQKTTPQWINKKHIDVTWAVVWKRQTGCVTSIKACGMEIKLSDNSLQLKDGNVSV